LTEIDRYLYPPFVRADVAQYSAVMVDGWIPPQRGSCACTVHLESLLDVVLAPADPDGEPITVAELLDTGDLKADPLTEADRRRGGFGYHWSLWVGDAARGYYDDDASLRLDVGILEKLSRPVDERS